jgi:hypothetical protein
MKLAIMSVVGLALLTASVFLATGTRAQAQAPAPMTSAQGPAMKAGTRRARHPGKAAAKAAAPTPAPEAPKAAAEGDAAGGGPGETIEETGKRDPFAPLINNKKEANLHLPPGKAGLVIATVRVDGAVRSGTSMIAVVSNPDQSVYFIREGDRLYDGDVEKIGLDGVTFKENSKDAFGKPVERMVTKRIYASAGEQQ